MLKKQFDPNNSNAMNFLGLNDADAFNASVTLWGLTVSQDGVRCRSGSGWKLKAA
jgi:hypothetical protein